MVTVEQLPTLSDARKEGYRLVNSKFPPIELFDDVAGADEFQALYQIQALTNPRLQNEVGRLELVALDQIPFGIAGCSYATAPFTHVNPEGSRFSDGSFGVLYVADQIDTAIAEVRYHQNHYWSQVVKLNYDRFVFRGLNCHFSEAGLVDATRVLPNDGIYASEDYSQSRQLGQHLKNQGSPGLRYHSVRSPGNVCWGLLTPRLVTSVIQGAHFEMIWNGQITSVNRVSNA
jgi:hypothetical protein